MIDRGGKGQINRAPPLLNFALVVMAISLRWCRAALAMTDGALRARPVLCVDHRWRFGTVDSLLCDKHCILSQIFRVVGVDSFSKAFQPDKGGLMNLGVLQKCSMG
jgi:hypothetical protein